MMYRRPVLRHARTPLQTLLEGLTALGAIAIVALTVWGYATLPATIPIHYGLSGATNAYGGKESLLLLPIIAICLAFMFTLVGRAPHRFNYPWPITEQNAPRQYYLARLLLCWLALEIVWMLCVMQWLIIQAAQNAFASSLLLVVPVLVVVLLVTIILYVSTAARAR